MRGFLYGLGAAAACSVGYAIVTMATGMELALIAILVGYLVGRAVRIGSRGLGGRRCQVLAVVLTYLAITTSYVPLVIKGIREGAKAEQTKKGPESDQAKKPATLTDLGVALAVITGIAVVSPILGLSAGVSGILGVLIIGFGLRQAWRQTGRDERLLMGPYELKEGQALG